MIVLENEIKRLDAQRQKTLARQKAEQVNQPINNTYFEFPYSADEEDDVDNKEMNGPTFGFKPDLNYS